VLFASFLRNNVDFGDGRINMCTKETTFVFEHYAKFNIRKLAINSYTILRFIYIKPKIAKFIKTLIKIVRITGNLRDGFIYII